MTAPSANPEKTAAKPRPLQPIRPASTVIIVRDAQPQFEVFMLRRTRGASFAGGMFVFPGGRVDGDDHLHKYDRVRVEPAHSQAPQLNALGYEWRGFYIAAIRETFEEAGLLLAYEADGSLLSYETDAKEARFDAYRTPLHDGELSLLELCEQERLKLAFDQVHYYNRFVTPLGRPRRFDTRFFIARAPQVQVGRHDTKETVDSVWISPAEALERNAAREFDLMRVTQLQLKALNEFAQADDLLAMASTNSKFPVSRPEVPVDLPLSTQ
ncbi:MAG: NUDIX hydrolase [Pseudomonadota bacterium]